MTLEEFNNTGYGGGDKVAYHGNTYPVHRVDFTEALFAIDNYNDPENLSWVRCENVKFISGYNG